MATQTVPNPVTGWTQNIYSRKSYKKKKQEQMATKERYFFAITERDTKDVRGKVIPKNTVIKFLAPSREKAAITYIKYFGTNFIHFSEYRPDKQYYRNLIELEFKQ